MAKRICKVCHKQIPERRHWNAKTCSMKCAQENERRNGLKSMHKYFASPKGKDALRKYQQSDKGKATMHRYLQSAKGKAALKRAGEKQKKGAKK